MCGVVGIAQPGSRQKFNVEDVKRMASAMVHRGPDDEGFHDSGNAILGMRRLSIIDLESGHQPIANQDGTIWVVNNGEIYNFRQLRRELRRRGYTFRTESDTEVIVHLYEEFGESFLEHLEGMFGMALWDARKEQLIVARDRLGIKPVYYWQSNGCVAFASEVKSLLSLPGVHAKIDQQALTEYLGIGYSVAPHTIYEGIKKLSPGTALLWQGGRTSLRQYWSLPTEVDTGPQYAEWVERIREEFGRAVRDHMVSDVPVGAFLSGGIDSSAVVSLMAGASNEPINTYSIGYRGSQVADYYNELPYARLVADRIGTHHREIQVQPDVANLLPKLVWHLEEPISDSAITTTYLVSELAADSVKVILSGVGGDELFAGYTRYLGDHYSSIYQKIPNWARRNVLSRIAKVLPSGRQNRAMDLARYAKRFIQANQLDWQERYRFYVALCSDQLLDELSQGTHRSPGGFARIAAKESGSDELLNLLRVDAQTQLSEDLLLLTDKMSMAVSLECRVPFLDHKLVEMAATIPAQHKLPNGRLKGLLKDALKDLLPSDVVDRRKRGFGAPVGAWFKDELAAVRDYLLSNSVVERRGLFDPEVVARICNEHDRSKEDFTDLILVLINLEIWSRLFLDGLSHEDVAAELSERTQAASQR